MFLKVANACLNARSHSFCLTYCSESLARGSLLQYAASASSDSFGTLQPWHCGMEKRRFKHARGEIQEDLDLVFLPQKESHIISILFVIFVWNQEPFNFRTCPFHRAGDYWCRFVHPLYMLGAIWQLQISIMYPFGWCDQRTGNWSLDVSTLPLEIGDICFQASISTPNTQFGVHSAVLSLLFANSRCHFMPGSNDCTPRRWWHLNPRLCLRRGAYTQCKWYD